MKSIFIIFCAIYTILLSGCGNDKSGKSSTITHQLQRMQKDFHEEEQSIAYDEVNKMLAHAIEFRETDIAKSHELMLDAIKKMKRSRLRSYELRADIHNTMGTILQRKHDYSQALEEYDRALHLYDSAALIPMAFEKKKILTAKLASAQVNNGIVEMHTHDYYHAKIGFDQVIANESVDNKQKSYAMQMKASVIRKEIMHSKPQDHSIEEIWNCYEAAYALNKDRHAVTKNMADFLSEQGAYKQADQLYDKVLNLTDHEDPREKKNEEGDIHFRKCKNLILNFDIHKDKSIIKEILKQLEEDVHTKYYDTHYLQADIEYLMALGYHYVSNESKTKKHLMLSTQHNAKSINALARNALLRSYIGDKVQSINELYRYASLANEHWKFQIEKRLVEMLKSITRIDEAKEIEDNLKNEHQILLENINAKHPDEVVRVWNTVKSSKSYIKLL